MSFTQSEFLMQILKSESKSLITFLPKKKTRVISNFYLKIVMQKNIRNLYSFFDSTLNFNINEQVRK